MNTAPVRAALVLNEAQAGYLNAAFALSLTVRNDDEDVRESSEEIIRDTPMSVVNEIAQKLVHITRVIGDKNDKNDS
ncbi:MAG: hypothetical protein H0U60_19610 [Blastocatellia bacterium]|nr:hypothetical protein [Blastocatellia bacterium]